MQIAFKRLLETTTMREKLMCNRKLTTSEAKVLLILILFHCNISRKSEIFSLELNVTYNAVCCNELKVYLPSKNPFENDRASRRTF